MGFLPDGWAGHGGTARALSLGREFHMAVIMSEFCLPF